MKQQRGTSKNPLIGMQRKAQTGAIRRYCEDLQRRDAPEYRVFRSSQSLAAYSMGLTGHFGLAKRMEYARSFWEVPFLEVLCLFDRNWRSACPI
jgi:hypothetical protein